MNLISSHASDAQPRLTLEQNAPVWCGRVNQQNALCVQ